MEILKMELGSKEVCGFYSVTAKTLSNWVAKGFPRNDKNRYPLKAGFDWWRKNVGGERFDELHNQRLKYQIAKTRREELRAEQDEGVLIHRDQPIRWLSELVMAAKEGFVDLPKRMAEILAPELDPREVEDLLYKEIWEILDRLGKGKKVLKDRLPKLAKGEEDGLG